MQKQLSEFIGTATLALVSEYLVEVFTERIRYFLRLNRISRDVVMCCHLFFSFNALGILVLDTSQYNYQTKYR